ncbi:MAG TPA: hypothetical protein VF384_13965 [Planctomycetota bacterium]
MPPTPWSLLLVAHAALGSQLVAQAFQPLPAFVDVADSNQSLGLPFGKPGFRTQILVDAASFTLTGATLNSISFRADRWLAPPTTSTQVPNVTVELSHTNKLLGALSATFANNITGTATTVFQGTVTLPAQGIGGAGPLPWNIVIQFSQPYAFTTSQGNLLIDIVGNNPAAGTPNYHLDAVQAGGAATQFGVSGQHPSFDNLLLYVSTGVDLVPRLISPGNTIDFTSTLFFSASPGLLALGTAALTPPVDLSVLGAPTNFLYMDPIVFATHNWMQHFIGWMTTSSLPLPNSTTLIGATIYGQSVILVPAANPLGLILSHAVEVRIGDEFEALPLQQVDSTNPASATGVLVDFGTPAQPERGAVAIRLGGAFF